MHNIAQIGIGRMGALHLRNVVANPRLKLTWIVDPAPEAANAARQYQAKITTSLDEALADPNVKGVVVASPTAFHLEHVLACLKAGKAVFCEKPLDLDLGRLKAAEKELSKPAAPLFVAFNRRFDPHFRKLKRHIVDGTIGALETINIINHDPAAPPAHFIGTSGGLFKDFTIHDFDMAAWLMPDPLTEIFAWTSCLVDPAIAEAGDVDTARLLLRDAKGRMCMISNTRRSGCGYDQRIQAFGSKGMASANAVPQDATEIWQEHGALRAPLHPGFIGRYAEAYRAELDHFADILDGKAKPETSYDASIQSLALAEAAARSVTLNAPVKL
ncbi:MAG: Gfo/Idh/MocA family oxidoreductase [Rhodospirillaceae bacterium]|nr:Gfo/Idh/MocA family oxidoreductase [Rhodospirillaceae bacterium]